MSMKMKSLYKNWTGCNTTSNFRSLAAYYNRYVQRRGFAAIRVDCVGHPLAVLRFDAEAKGCSRPMIEKPVVVTMKSSSITLDDVKMIRGLSTRLKLAAGGIGGITGIGSTAEHGLVYVHSSRGGCWSSDSVIVSSEEVFPLPEDLDVCLAAAALPSYLAAWGILHTAFDQLQAGDSLYIAQEEGEESILSQAVCRLAARRGIQVIRTTGEGEEEEGGVSNDNRNGHEKAATSRGSRRRRRGSLPAIQHLLLLSAQRRLQRSLFPRLAQRAQLVYTQQATATLAAPALHLPLSALLFRGVALRGFDHSAWMTTMAMETLQQALREEIIPCLLSLSASSSRSSQDANPALTVSSFKLADFALALPAKNKAISALQIG